jgi:hypothetical protein
MKGFGETALSPPGGITTPVSIRPKSVPVSITKKPGSAGGSRTGAGTISSSVDDAGTPARGAGRGAREAIESTGKKGFLKNGKGLAIGAGAAVIAGLAYSGRRGEGSSGGRTSMSRY